ncbi:MAG: hypothetical protein M3511_03005 [Deinococcota bacterium]|nr:hypothetical protein [Deinococcota bacterium]
MAQFILPFNEIVDVIKGVRPLPEELKEISCEGDTVYLKLAAGSVPLEGHVQLKYERFESGVATFSVQADASSPSQEEPYKTLMRAVGVPRPGALNLHVPSVAIDLNLLISQFASGITVEEFSLSNSEVTVIARVGDFKLK